MKRKIISILLVVILLQSMIFTVFATTQSDLNNAKDKLSEATKTRKQLRQKKKLF